MPKLRKVDELERPPIVGEDYLVLSIEVRGHFLPVFAVAHIDHHRPDYGHFHPDRRFLQEELFSLYSGKPQSPFAIRNPFAPHPNDMLQNVAWSGDLGPADYRPFTCLRDLPPWHGMALPFIFSTDTCAQARWKDGKPYCPHQGLPLAQFWDGETETIRCPMHGLLVDMGDG